MTRRPRALRAGLALLAAVVSLTGLVTVAQAAGDYLAFLDGDDVWDPRKTEWQLDAFAGGHTDHTRQRFEQRVLPFFAQQFSGAAPSGNCTPG